MKYFPDILPLVLPAFFGILQPLFNVLAHIDFVHQIISRRHREDL